MSESSGILGRFAGKGVYPHQLAWVLLLPFRNLYLSPEKLALRLGLREDSRVLELGCGPGYFGPAIARRIPRGRLSLIDIQPEMIEKARRRIQKKGIQNVDLQVCKGSTLPYGDESFDVIYLVTVLGEIASPSASATEMFRVLRHGGIVSISEQAGDPDSLTVSQVEDILLPAGFVRDTVFGRGRTFTANFRKPQ